MLPKRIFSFVSAFVLTLLAMVAHAGTVIEYYNPGLDHYFITSSPAEIAALDSGRTVGWNRTGASFPAFDTAVEGAYPVCRIYLPPSVGNTHFYSASASECATVPQTITAAVAESSAVMYVGMPTTIKGECAKDWTPVYRVWNKRADTNHRYTTSRTIRDQMVALGYIAEGYGDDAVIMCAAS